MNLFFAYPLPMSQSPTFNAGWVSILADFLVQVEKANLGPNRLVCGSRFAELAIGKVRKENLILIDESELYSQIINDPELGSQSLHSVYSSLNQGSRDTKVVGDLLLNSILKHLGSSKPDLIFSFASRADFFLAEFPNSKIIHIEKSAFSRGSFPDALTFDPKGIYGSSLGALKENLSDLTVPKEYLQIAQAFRYTALKTLRENNPFKNLNELYTPDQKILIPLQVSEYPPFETQSHCRTQFEFLYDCLSQIPKHINVFVTEYIQWGAVITRKPPADNLEFLRKAFPNLVFYNWFRDIPFTSQYLIPHMDFIWSVASSVGLQGALLDVPAGGPRGSQNSAYMIADSIEKLLDDDCRNQTDQTELCAKYLAYQSVPLSLLNKTDFTTRIFEIFTDTPNGQPWERPLLTSEEIEHQVIDRLSNYEAKEACNDSREFNRASSEARYLESRARSTEIRSSDSDRKFILLNDTRAIEGFIHFGCNIVVETILTQMNLSGTQLFGTANTIDDCQKLQKLNGFENVSLIIFNGEGSLHHDNHRCLGLFQFCETMSGLGKSCVLINSCWFENSNSYARYLRYFELVSVRESLSLEQISEHRPDARLTPDCSIAACYDSMKQIKKSSTNQSQDLCVFDSVIRETAVELFDFARANRSPFFIMGQINYDFLSRPDLSLTAEPWEPAVLETLATLSNIGYALTGRFHGLTICLATLRPTLALASNTPKIESLLDDIGIRDSVMLPANWVFAPGPQKIEHLQLMFETWNTDTAKSLNNYLECASLSTNELFSDIRSLIL